MIFHLVVDDGGIEMVDSSLAAQSKDRLRCPSCHDELEVADGVLTCCKGACGSTFPVVGGVPILICEDRSVFSVANYVEGASAAQPGLLSSIAARLPVLGVSVGTEDRNRQLARSLRDRRPHPLVLVVGGATLGKGMSPLVCADIELVETDVVLGPRTEIVCDAHDLPFADGTFDVVVAQAVLEHVADPFRCVDEIFRVLKEDGLVYAETPFIQQVHMAAHDFTRFTMVGHRRLFRAFKELSSGACGGPGMALAWSYRNFLLSFTSRSTARRLADAFASLTGFWLKYFDRYLVQRPAALDAASGYYFMGVKATDVISDREVLASYRGAQRT